MVKELSLEELYEQQIKLRPKEERLRLIVMIARDLAGMSQPEFRPYILRALAKLGGRARVEEVLEHVEKMVKPFLSPEDLEPVPSGKELRWHNKLRWERFNMVQEGLLRPKSPRGIWELTKRGWQEVMKLL